MQAVQDHAVGDDDDLVEDLRVGRVMQAGETMRRPGDRVRLARARRVLHEVVVPRAVGASVFFEPQYRIPLVVTGEDQEAVVM